MKTHTHLFEHVVTFDALHAAYLRARRGKRRAWPCRSFERDLEGNLIQLQNELIWGQYRIGGYRPFEVHEPKTRTITALVEFRDRVVQHALMAVLEPLWEASFINASFACRVGKGTHAGADHADADDAATADAAASDPLARWLAGGALVVALAALGVALIRRRRD